MNKKILLVLGIIFSVNHALADGQSYGPIIQRQSKQIQELKSRILELENAIEEIRINTKKSGSGYQTIYQGICYRSWNSDR